MTEPLIIGRYMICDEIGSGGMATVHLGRILGAAGFSRVVAIKRLHASAAESDKLATMLIDEARIVARIRHPNVAPTLDVIRAEGELLLIMEYVHGPSLAWLQQALLQRAEAVPPPIAVRIALDALEGLHAAHQAKSERGRPLGIVHRDVSPQNILVGADGVARVLDFGIAKAEGRLAITRFGEIKGKLRYMSPEQLRGEPVDCRTDVFATGIVLWEMLTGRRLFGRPSDGSPLDVLLKDMLSTLLELPSGVASVSPAVDRVVLKALKSDRAERFATADEMAVALAAATDAATPKELGAWVGRIAGDLLAKRTALLDSIEQVSAIMSVEPVASPAVLAPAPPTASLAAASTVAAPTASMNQITLPIHDSSTAPRTVGSPVARREAANETSGTLMSPRGAIPPAVETTSLSVASDSSPRRANVPFLVVLGLTLLVVASAGGLLAVKRAKSHAAAKAAVSSLPSASVSAVPSASVSSTPPSPVAPPPSAAPPVAMPSAPPAGSGHVAKPTGSARRPHPSAAPARPACDPPFTIDAEGVRIPRPECMGN